MAELNLMVAGTFFATIRAYHQQEHINWKPNVIIDLNIAMKLQNMKPFLSYLLVQLTYSRAAFTIVLQNEIILS